MKENQISKQLRENEPQLKRSMGFWGLVIFGLVFMNPASTISYFGYTQILSGGHTVLVFLLSTVVIFFTCLSYAKMVKVFPNSGSAYTYASKGIHPKFGFLVGWAMLLDYALLPMYAFTLTGLYMSRNFGIFSAHEWLLIFAVIVFVVNIVGLKIADIFNVTAIGLQMVIAVIFAILSAFYVTKHGTAIGYSAVIYNPGTFHLQGIAAASTLGILSFLGFDAISTISEESKVTPKKVSKAIIYSVIIQGVLLCGLAYICSLLFPTVSFIKNPDTIAYDLYTLVGGSSFNFVVIAITQFMTLMCISTSITAASRLLYSMGRDDVLPKKIFGHLNNHFHTPTWNIAIITAVCIIGGLTLDWSTIASVVSFGGMFGFCSVNIAVIRYFYFIKKEKKIIENLILPSIGVVTILFVMITTSTICKMIGFSWIACGVIYLIYRSRTSSDFRAAIKNGLTLEG